MYWEILGRPVNSNDLQNNKSPEIPRFFGSAFRFSWKFPFYIMMSVILLKTPVMSVSVYF